MSVNRDIPTIGRETFKRLKPLLNLRPATLNQAYEPRNKGKLVYVNFGPSAPAVIHIATKRIPRGA